MPTDERFWRGAPRFPRYVAIGDSSTEGIDDPDDRGGYIGWADRLAERLAHAQGSVLYANLAVRGRHTRDVRKEQLQTAARMRPTLATVFSGTNDVVSRHFNLRALAADIEEMQGTLAAAGATVLTITLPDLTPVMPMARRLTPRVLALNAAVRAAAARTGAIVVDLAAFPVASDPRLWSEDRLHANAAGHARIAHALAHTIGVPGADESWMLPLPEQPGRSIVGRLGDEWRWVRRYLAPWLWRHARGISSGDRVTAKRATLETLEHPIPSL
jgi:lysophospholipase L1-like esterase